MRKAFTSVALGVFALFGVYACLNSGGDGGNGGDGGGGNGGGTFTLEFDFDVLNSPGGATGTLVTRQVEYDCEDGVAVADTQIDTSHFAISGGNLYVWGDSTDCYATRLSGSSNTVIGTWTTTTGAAEAEIPDPYKPLGCTAGPDTTEDAFGGLFGNGSVTYTVSSTKIHVKVAGMVCFAQLFSESFADSTSGFTVSYASCDSVELLNNFNQKTLAVSSSLANDMITITMASGGKTCAMSGAIPLPGAMPDCSKPGFGELDSTTYACLLGLDFFQVMAKQGAAGNAEFQKRVGASLRKFRVRP